MRKPVLRHMQTTKVQISTVVVRSSDSIIPVVAMYKISRLVKLLSHLIAHMVNDLLCENRKSIPKLFVKKFLKM